MINFMRQSEFVYSLSRDFGLAILDLRFGPESWNLTYGASLHTLQTFPSSKY